MTAHPTHQKLARLMARATHEILWEQAEPRAKGVSLQCRAGRGRATYHRFDALKQHHDIVFGALMVADKRCPQASTNWLSTREIRQRGYWHGTVSMLNLLTHTCCHEFAHLQQTLAGDRQRGRVHTPFFYRLLDELHRSGQADTVKGFLRSHALQGDLPLDEAVHPLPAGPARSGFSPGDRVRFGHPPARKEGRVRRVNRKTCTVDGLGADRGRRYRVPPQLMQSLELS